ncbi:MAG: YiiX family permuted papain-like enzyme [Saprospiraceae bacterium]|nr:YiiX family permuted papain-like enzyme [Saprospiraceae bacterium]
MKYFTCLAFISILAFGCSQSEQGQAIATEVAQVKLEAFSFKDGDLIFQTSLSQQSEAIQLATKSPFSHCGIVFHQNGKAQVFEAIEPVTVTAMEQWVARGKDGRYVVRRLKGAESILSSDALEKMKAEGNRLLGKHYDAAFEWSDERIYCSELIWKVYKSATGLEVGKLEKLRDYDLSSPTVRRLLSERYGKNITLEETVISPSSVFESPLLETVFSN